MEESFQVKKAALEAMVIILLVAMEELVVLGVPEMTPSATTLVLLLPLEAKNLGLLLHQVAVVGKCLFTSSYCWCVKALKKQLEKICDI
jgi:hypothetical protein